jgi:hypothetical protein
MSVTKAVISVPSAQLKGMRELAKKKNLPLTELIRNAYRSYRYRRALKGLNESGRAVAAELGIAEADVAPSFISSARSGGRGVDSRANEPPQGGSRHRVHFRIALRRCPSGQGVKSIVVYCR